jgi:hypothetical protein
MAAKILPIETLQRLFRYEHETGNVYWIAEGKGRIKKKAAGTVVKAGYIGIMIDGKRYYAHRIAWALHHGKHPTDQLDHINGIKTDNRIVNLREATNSQNGKNLSLNKNNKTGYSGVCFKSNAWTAYIKVDYTNLYLGRFAKKEDAIAARLKAEQEFYEEWKRTRHENLR